MIGYDIIGDVHGHAATLETLLNQLGYENSRGFYRHETRKAVFLGDLIDRGRENFKTLALVKAMTDNGEAQMVLGNHEFNALCFHTRSAAGEFLRPHVPKNINQHRAVLDEIETYGEAQWRDYLEWFRMLPLFLAIPRNNVPGKKPLSFSPLSNTDSPGGSGRRPGGFRVVHACWDRRSVEFITHSPIRDGAGRLTDAFLEQASTVDTAMFEAVEILLKGKEVWLPREILGLHDKDGHLRRKLRVKWWMSPADRAAVTHYHQIARTDKQNLEILSHVPLPEAILKEFRGDDGFDGETPAFVGHYWFTGEPRLLSKRVACLDYSVARGGQLVCYRWDGERDLDPAKFAGVF